jgi:hypothetical protein
MWMVVSDHQDDEAMVGMMSQRVSRRKNETVCEMNKNRNDG